MSPVMSFACGVDNTLLMNILMVGISADLVLVVPSYVIKFPPMVNGTRIGFSFSGQLAHTILAYVIFAPGGMSLIVINFMVSVPNSLPISNVMPLIQSGLRVDLLSSKYSAGLPVSGLIAFPKNAYCGAFSSTYETLADARV